MVAVLLIACAVGANVAYSKAPLHEQAPLLAAIARQDASERIAAIRDALALVPARAAVAADYTLVPHLSHRPIVYMFPNPFFAEQWGLPGVQPSLPGGLPHDPETIEYIVVRDEILGDSGRRVLSSLLAGAYFARIGGRDGVVDVYRRVARAAHAPAASCGDWDADNDIDETDARRITAAITAGRPCPVHVCDLDGDGTADLADAGRLARHARGEAVALACAAR
jgi:hypothetical protein